MRPLSALSLPALSLPAVLAGCSGDFGKAVGDPTVTDWAGPVGGLVALGPADEPTDTPLLVTFSRDDWDLRWGQDWRTAQELELYPVTVDGQGYKVDGAVLMPGNPDVGGSAGSAQVVAEGEHETWYGTFPDTRTVDVGDGPFRGTAVLAAGVGPLRLDFEGQEWELVYYE